MACDLRTKVGGLLRPLPDYTWGEPPLRAFFEDICALGVERVSGGGLPYAVVAARSNPRWWMLPLSCRRAAAAGLEMIQPVTKAARLSKFAARGIARVGPLRWLGHGRLELSGFPDLAGAFGDEAAHVAYFTGTDGPHRKTAIQVMDGDGLILGYAKFSREEHIRPYIRNEAEMLALVAALGLISADIPKVISLRDNADLTLLVTDSCKSANVTVPTKLGAVHLSFLDELRKCTSQVRAAPLLEALASRLPAVENIAGAGWSARITRTLAALHPVAGDIELCLAHGDFTPWNSFVRLNRLYVFDWEYARTDWPVGFDLVHFMLAIIPPTHHLQDLPRILEIVARTQFNANKRAARRAILLSLLCHAIFYLGRLADVRGALTDWSDGPVRAALIDCLLNAGGLDA